MATRSEDIRLQINNVRYKKGDGTLYLMAERLGWMPDTKDNFTISHKYSDIKMQKISPEGKSKIQLQIVLHTGDNTTFQFASLEDRTAVKDALLQILPLFKGKMPKDREKKALLLSKNPHLLQLYKDLVESKIISAEDFWSQFVDDNSVEPDEAQQSEQQDVGVSTDFLAGIPMNGKQIKGTVHVETLWAILKTYPKVAEKHQELVPTKMSETEFWNKFFQSRYFNRDRTKDLFSDVARSEEKEWTASVKEGLIDPLCDFSKFDASLDLKDDDPTPSSSHANSEQLLIKRCTQQSIRILGSLEAAGAPKDGSQTSAGAIKTETPQLDKDASKDQEKHQHEKHDWTFYDLAGIDVNGDYLDDESGLNSRIHYVEREKYSIVPQGQQHQLTSAIVKSHLEAISSWQPKLTECLGAKDATEALKNLSPAGYLMRSSNSNRLVDTVPEEIQKKVKSAYYASNELLRHFWLCFPALEPSLETKLVKIHETLKRFESSKLQPLYDSLPRDQRHLLDHIMRGQIKAAQRKYDNWRSKKRQRELQGKAKSSGSNTINKANHVRE